MRLVRARGPRTVVLPMAVPVAVIVPVAVGMVVAVVVLVATALNFLRLCHVAPMLALRVEVAHERARLRPKQRAHVQRAVRARHDRAERVDDSHDLLKLGHALQPQQIDLIQDHVVRDLDLLHQQVDDGPEGGVVAAEVGPRRAWIPVRVLFDECMPVHNGDLHAATLQDLPVSTWYFMRVHAW